MAKVLTFSRVFPVYHPKAGQPTHFVEKIWNGLNAMDLPVPKNADMPKNFMWSIMPLSGFGAKYHTIRAGKRWKAGDMFSPRVWSGNPYISKQITIAPDLQIKHIWDFDIKYGYLLLDGRKLCNSRFYAVRYRIPIEIATNDGLTIDDLLDWFKYPKDFSGQILCWSDDVRY
jgi:hypothetical protein